MGGESHNSSGKESGNSPHLPPDVPEPDVERDRDPQEDGDKKPSRVPIDAPESDVLDDWQGDVGDRPSQVPIDAPEADVLDQARPADLDDEDRNRS